MRLDKESPRYFATHWRNIPEATTDALDDFLFWLEYDSYNERALEDHEVTEQELKLIKALVDVYLGRDMGKVKQGENQMLDQWIKAVEGVNRSVE